MAEVVLKVENLKVYHPVKSAFLARVKGYVKAVDGVSFQLHKGETLALVGESGSGKTTIARAITHLVRPTDGTINCDRRLAMIFQDPLASLNPRHSVREILLEALPKSRRSEEALMAALEEVGLGPESADRYPHEFSGGQRQRICIARAIASEPEILLCDEAVSALDLSIRSQILDLLSQLKVSHELSMLFITHDLGVVRHFADRVVVLEHGRIAEQGEVEELFTRPTSDYTRELIASIPRLKPQR